MMLNQSKSKTTQQFKSINSLLKVVILGDGGVGKSCLMNRFVSNHFDEHVFHTIGVEFLNKEITVDSEIFTLQIWDTAGQERFKSLRTPFYRGSDLCLLTYAVDDLASFRDLITWKNEFLYYADVKNPDTFPFIVIGNKSDVDATQREVATEDLQAWSVDNSIPCFIETSAKTASGVQEAFTMAVHLWRQLESKRESHDLTLNDETIQLTNQDRKLTVNCCS